MSSSDPRTPQSRPGRLLAAGGTISMQGERAVPRLDATQLVQAVPDLDRFADLTAENVLGLPGPQISLGQALDLARRAGDAAAGGAGVVITTGTDTLEEIAMLCALHHDAESPIVLTGANRPASAPGADGPANLLDAVTLAASAPPAGPGGGGGAAHARRPDRRRPRRRRVRRRAPDARHAARPPRGGAAHPGRHHRPARARVDAARHL